MQFQFVYNFARYLRNKAWLECLAIPKGGVPDPAPITVKFCPHREGDPPFIDLLEWVGAKEVGVFVYNWTFGYCNKNLLLSIIFRCFTRILGWKTAFKVAYFFSLEIQAESNKHSSIKLVRGLKINSNSPWLKCASYMMHKMVHTWRGNGCSIFIDIDVKRQPNPWPIQVCSILWCTAHIQLGKIISK